MTKDLHKMLFLLNIFFLVLNAGFMFFTPEPVVNFFCGMVNLIAAFISYQFWTNEKLN